LSGSHHFGLCVAGALLMALGMGVTNAAVFKLLPQEIPSAVGGASGWVGGLGAFGGFIIPLLMGFFANASPESGYSQGFVIFMALAVLSLALIYVLKVAHKNRELAMIKSS